MSENRRPMHRAIALLAVLAAGCAIPRAQKEIIREATDRVFPAVVFIKPIQKEFRGGEMQKVQVFGSGAIISEDGIVVTNNHVAEKATVIKCILFDKEELTAKVIGLDPETDLAVLKLDLSAHHVFCGECKDLGREGIRMFLDAGSFRCGTHRKCDRMRPDSVRYRHDPCPNH